MRVRTAALLALLAAITAMTLGGLTTGDAAPACPVPTGCMTEPLPAPITITAGRVSYRIARDGRARQVPPAASPYPGNTSWFPGTGTWFELWQRHRLVGPTGRGYLVVGRGQPTRARHALWRSRTQFAADQLGLIAAGPAAVAFQHDHRLYLAAYGGLARPVARRELPLGWTTSGLYTYSYPRRELLLRDTTGSILKIIARRPGEYVFDPATGSLYLLNRGALIGAYGARVRPLGSLASFGMSPDTYLQPLGGLIELLDNTRLTVMRPNGSLFATTATGSEGVAGALTVAPDHRAVAFTADVGPPSHPGGYDIKLLSVGARAAVTVHREPASFTGCAQGAGLHWRGPWLLYADSGGDLALIDTVGDHRAIQLTGVVHRLLGARAGFDAHWSR